MAAEEEAREGEPGVDLRRHALATPTGPDLSYGLLAVRSTVAEASPWVALVVVGESEDGEPIVALPGRAWHRTQTRRLVPTSSFQLPRGSTVRVVVPEERGEPLDDLSVKIWIGRLSSDWARYVEIVEVGTADLELGVSFGEALEAEHADCIPDVVEAAGDRIAYQTAEEELGGGPAAGDAPPAWATRVEELERGMGDVREILGKLGKTDGEATAKAAAPRPSALRAPGGACDAAGGGWTRPCSGASSAGSRGPREPPGGDGEGGVSEQDASERPGSFYQGCSFTPRGGRWAAGRDRRRGRCGGGSASTSWRRPNCHGHREADRDCLAPRFGGSPPEAGGQHARAHGRRLWVGKERAGRRQGAHLCESLGGEPGPHPAAVPDDRADGALARGNTDEGLARSLVGLAAIEQLSLDRGSWTLAEPMLLEEPAPLSSFHGRQMPTGSEQPFTRLVDARSIELLVYQVKEVDDYLERRRRLGSRRGVPPDFAGGRPGRRGQGGGRGSSRLEGEAKGEAEGKDGRRPGRDCMTPRRVGRTGRGAPDEFVSAGEAPPRVPGAAARPILAASLWSSLPRWVLRQPTPFASFFRCLVTQKPKQGAPATGQAFPMPLPYPSVYVRSARRRTSRLRAAERHAVNLVVAVLSWLALDCPAAGPAWISLGQPLSGEQRGAVRRLEGSVRVLVRQPMVGPAEMGRVAAKVEAVEQQLGRLETIARRLGRVSSHYLGAPFEWPLAGDRRLPF